MSPILLEDLFQEPVATGAPTWDGSHLWRMIDESGGVAPDSVGSADLTLGGTTIAKVADGIEFGSANAVLSGVLSELSLDLTNLNAPYTWYVSCRAYDWGFSDWGRFVSYQLNNTASVDTYIQITGSSLGARKNSLGGSYYTWSNNVTVPSNLDFVLKRDPTSPASPAVSWLYLFVNGVLEITTNWANSPFSTPDEATTDFRIGNRTDLDRAWNGRMKWSGIRSVADDDSTVLATVAAGRPVAP